MLGDRLGRKRMLIAALALFGVASVACAYAQSSPASSSPPARLLGLGAAVIMPLSGAVLTVLFGEGNGPGADDLGDRERARHPARPAASAAGCWTTSGGARSS